MTKNKKALLELIQDDISDLAGILEYMIDDVKTLESIASKIAIKNIELLELEDNHIPRKEKNT